MSEASISPTPTSKTAQSFVTEFTVFQGRQEKKEGGRRGDKRGTSFQFSFLFKSRLTQELLLIVN